MKKIFIDDFFSASLRRKIKMEVVLPPLYEEYKELHFPVIYLNDGQTLHQVRMEENLTACYEQKIIPPVIIVAIHAGNNRMQEYGVASSPDYRKRGNKADKYSRFMTSELRKLINSNFRTLTDPVYNSIAGYSLGALSAFDIAWNHPHLFGSAGMFSGSFWWRSRGYGYDFDETRHRIMHQVVKNAGNYHPQLRFWFQCGTLDEMADRNQNDIIDAIDDTLDLISELKKTGYTDREIHYVEMINGRHHESTWADAMPLFLKWLFN